jgi:hypothetical protein
MGYWGICDSSRPGMAGDVYQVPYAEAVQGYRHGFMTHHNGVIWTRSPNHPPDPRCPECSAYGPAT